MNIEDLRINMNFVGPNNHEVNVIYNPYTYDHDSWDEDGYLGRIKLREFWFNDYKVKLENEG